MAMEGPRQPTQKEAALIALHERVQIALETSQWLPSITDSVKTQLNGNFLVPPDRTIRDALSHPDIALAAPLRCLLLLLNVDTTGGDDKIVGIAGNQSAAVSFAQDVYRCVASVKDNVIIELTSFLLAAAPLTLSPNGQDHATVTIAASLMGLGREHPLLLASQALFLFTRHHPHTSSNMKDSPIQLQDVTKLLLKESQRHAELTRKSHIADFVAGPQTRTLAAVTYFTVFSLVNLLVPRVVNDSAVLTLKDEVTLQVFSKWLYGLSVELAGTERAQQQRHGFVSGAGGALGGGPGSRVSQAARVTATRSALCAPVEGYLSVLLLSLSIAQFFLEKLQAKPSGNSSAVTEPSQSVCHALQEAFFGNRIPSAKLLTGKGKVCKRIVQLSPCRLISVLSPQQYLTAPFDLVSLLLDDMVHVTKSCVGDVDIQSYSNAVAALQLDEQAALLPLPPQQHYHHHQQHANPSPALQRFDGVPHLLQLIGHLATNLPSSYFYPDSGITSSAITFFVFRNGLDHLRDAVEKHDERSELWEPFLLKLVRSYLTALAALSKEWRFAERCMHMCFGDDDGAKCDEIQWPVLLAQCKLCLGLTIDGNSAGGSRLASSSYQQTSSFSSALPTEAGARHAYTAHQQQRFSAAVVVFCHAVAVHHAGVFASTRADFFQEIQLLLQAPNLSQMFLGETLSLLAATVTEPAHEERLWQLLNELHIFDPSSAAGTAVATQQLLAASGGNLASAHSNGSAGANSGVVLSLLGHCAQEARTGVFDITIGLLQLICSLFSLLTQTRGRSSMSTTTSSSSSSFPSSRGPSSPSMIAALARFVSEEVLCGCQSREYAFEEQRHIITALACRVLSDSFLLFDAEGAPALTLELVMSTNRAPNDVLGDLLRVVHQTCSMGVDELTCAGIISARSVLALVNSAFDAESRSNGGGQQQQHFTFEQRTLTSSYFAKQLLLLSCHMDPEISVNALVLLDRVESGSVVAAVRELASSDGLLGGLKGNPNASAEAAAMAAANAAAAVIRDLTLILNPQYSAVRPSWGSPPASLLRLECVRSQEAEESIKTLQKSALLDLLLHHASQVQPVLVMWLCGYPDLARIGISQQQQPADMISGPDLRSLRKGHLFDSILQCANYPPFVEAHPDLSARSVELIYRMCSSKLLATQALRKAMCGRGAQGFVEMLGGINSSMVNSSSLIMLGFAMKYVGLETLIHFSDNDDSAGQHTPALQLVRRLFGRVVSAPLFEHVCREQHGLTHEGPTIEASRWLALVLRSLPEFPTLSVPGGVDPKISMVKNANFLQIDLAAVEKAFRDAGTAPSKMDAALEPFRRANQCAVEYASFAQFVDGWCAMVGISICKMTSLQPEDMLLFILSIAEAMQYVNVAALSTTVDIIAELVKTIGVIASCLAERCSSPAAGRAPPSSTRLSRCDVNSTIAAVITILVTKCAADPYARMHLYNSLDVLLSIPQLPIDPITLHKYRQPMFDLLLQDLRDPSSFPAHLSALSLLRRLLLFSTVAEAFCVSSCGVICATSLSTFLTVMLEIIDRNVVSFIVRRAVAAQEELGSLLMQIDCTYQILALLSQEHAQVLFRADSLSKGCRLECWQECSQVMLGHVTYAPENEGLLANGGMQQRHQQPTSTGNIHLCRDLVRRLLSAHFQWVNSMMVSLSRVDAAAVEVGTFVRRHQTLIQFAVSGPLALESVISTISLDLLEEATRLLLHLSTSCIAPQCRALTTLFTLPQLLSTLCRREIRKSSIFIADDGPGAIYAGVVPRNEGSAPSQRQLLLISRAVRNIAVFLLNVEHPETLDGEDSSNASNTQDTPRGIAGDPANMAFFGSMLGQLAYAYEDSVRLLDKIGFAYLGAIHSVGLLLQLLVMGCPSQQLLQHSIASASEAVDYCEAALKAHQHQQQQQAAGSSNSGQAAPVFVVPNDLDSSGVRAGGDSSSLSNAARASEHFSGQDENSTMFIHRSSSGFDTSGFGLPDHSVLSSAQQQQHNSSATTRRRHLQEEMSQRECRMVLHNLSRLIKGGK